MKVSDLVSLKMRPAQPPQEARHAIVLDVYINQDGLELAEVMWERAGMIRSYESARFEVISEV